MNSDQGEAALVDSYFLPGGILDPDDEMENDNIPTSTTSPPADGGAINASLVRAAFQNEAAAEDGSTIEPRRMIPNNPWSNQDTVDYTSSGDITSSIACDEFIHNPQHSFSSDGFLASVHASSDYPNNTDGDGIPINFGRQSTIYGEDETQQPCQFQIRQPHDMSALDFRRSQVAADDFVYQQLGRGCSSSPIVGNQAGLEISPDGNQGISQMNILERTIQRPQPSTAIHGQQHQPFQQSPNNWLASVRSTIDYDEPYSGTIQEDSPNNSNNARQLPNLQYPCRNISDGIADVMLGCRYPDGAMRDRLMEATSASTDAFATHHTAEHSQELAARPVSAGQGARHDDGEDNCGEESSSDQDGDEETVPECDSPSIPMELLSIRGIYKGDSLTSSLSTSTCASDGEEETPSVIDVERELEEELEVLADNASDHQQLIADMTGLLDSNISRNNDAYSENQDEAPAASIAKCGEGRYSDTYSRPPLSGVVRAKFQEKWAMLVTYIGSAVQFPDSNAILERAGRSYIISWSRKFAVSCANWMLQMRASLRVICQYLLDIQEILSIWVGQFLSSSRVVLVTTTKALILLASFLFQVWKYSLIEAVEEPHVTICYMVFYLMPKFCSLLIEFINLPHWTPHLITSVAVFLLCNQVKAGQLHSESSSLLFHLTESSSFINEKTGSDDQVGSTSQKDDDRKRPGKGSGSPRDEKACRTILRILRFVLPTFFIADGFSSEFGTIIGDSGASRLTTAYMMSLVRKNLVSSPIGWISWAVQVLVATYFRSSSMLDQVVLVVGLSSIRLIRYLEGQRLDAMRRKQKI